MFVTVIFLWFFRKNARQHASHLNFNSKKLLWSSFVTARCIVHTRGVPGPFSESAEMYSVMRFWKRSGLPTCVREVVKVWRWPSPAPWPCPWTHCVFQWNSAGGGRCRMRGASAPRWKKKAIQEYKTRGKWIHIYAKYPRIVGKCIYYFAFIHTANTAIISNPSVFHTSSQHSKQ